MGTRRTGPGMPIMTYKKKAKQPVSLIGLLCLLLNVPVFAADEESLPAP